VAQAEFFMPRYKLRGKEHGALPRTPPGGIPWTPGPLSLPLHVPERPGAVKVRFAAHNVRALDGSGPFRRFTEIRESGQTQTLLTPRLCAASRWSAPSCTTSLE